MPKLPESAQPVSALAGTSTAFIARALREGLPDALALTDSRDIEINLADIGELDGAALQLLVAAKREAADQGKNIRFINHPAPALKLLELCDLAGFFAARQAPDGSPENTLQPSSP